jgi:hypothetical protein
MRFLFKIAILALLAWGLYAGYKEVFKPFMDTAKSRVRATYGVPAVSEQQ